MSEYLFIAHFLNVHQSGVLTALAWLVPHETAAISVQVLCTPYNHAPCHFMQSHINKVFSCNLPPALCGRMTRIFYMLLSPFPYCITHFQSRTSKIFSKCHITCGLLSLVSEPVCCIHLGLVLSSHCFSPVYCEYFGPFPHVLSLLYNIIFQFAAVVLCVCMCVCVFNILFLFFYCSLFLSALSAVFP